MKHVVANTSGQSALDQSKAARANHNQVYMLVFRCLHDDVSWLSTFRRNFTRYLKHRYDENYSTVTRTNTQNLHLSVHVHVRVHTLWSPTWVSAGFLGGGEHNHSAHPILLYRSCRLHGSLTFCLIPKPCIHTWELQPGWKISILLKKVYGVVIIMIFQWQLQADDHDHYWMHLVWNLRSRLKGEN